MRINFMKHKIFLYVLFLIIITLFFSYNYFSLKIHSVLSSTNSRTEMSFYQKYYIENYDFLNNNSVMDVQNSFVIAGFSNKLLLYINNPSDEVQKYLVKIQPVSNENFPYESIKFEYLQPIEVRSNQLQVIPILLIADYNKDFSEKGSYYVGEYDFTLINQGSEIETKRIKITYSPSSWWVRLFF